MPGFKNDYRDRLGIYTGLEIDFISGKMGPADSKYEALGLDYKIGSVHSIFDHTTGTYPFG